MSDAIKPQADWPAILIDAVEKPGLISRAYHLFWRYSTGNQLLALFECASRHMEPGPIHTFSGWIRLGRHVKRGERAITLCMPVTITRKPDSKAEPTKDPPATFTKFLYRPHWFVLSQTEGQEFVPPELPEWQELRALESLRIERTAFDRVDGNVQGFARERKVAVSPIAVLPHKTLFHELAHVLLGHTAEGESLVEDERTPRSLREVEAESVALICCESLGLGGVAECRGYIQHWLQGEIIPEKSAHRIFKAADQILKAGHSQPPEESEPHPRRNPRRFFCTKKARHLRRA